MSATPPHPNHDHTIEHDDHTHGDQSHPHEEDLAHSGLGSTFVHDGEHGDESSSAPDPIIIDRVMSDVVISTAPTVDLDALRDIHSTHEPHADTQHDIVTVDLSLDSPSESDIRTQKHIEVYHDGSLISTDLSDELREDVRVTSEIRQDAEAHIVDARTQQAFTRESFDMFAPSQLSIWSRLGSLSTTLIRHPARVGTWLRRGLVLLCVVYLIGIASLVVTYTALSGIVWQDKSSVTSRSFVMQYTLGVSRLTLTPTLVAASWLPDPIGDVAKDLSRVLRVGHLGTVSLRELLRVDTDLAVRGDTGYGIVSLLMSHTGSQTSRPDVISVLESSNTRITRALSLLKEVRSDLESIRSPYREADRARMLSLLSQLIGGIELYESNRSEIHLALGAHKPMRYLILNQNRDEIRATGGFPGSVVFIEIDRGRITQKASRDIYLYDWRLYPFQVTPPPGIRELTTNYGLRDANYDPILKNNIEVMSQFHERSGYESLDAIITIHQGLIEDLLRVIGPVDFPEISTQITPDNFSLIISSIVEAKFGKNESAKDILFVFEKHLSEKLQSSLSRLPEVVGLVVSEINRGEIMAAWRDDRLSTLNHLLSGSPRAIDSGKNWFFPVFTSLSGNKSDRYIHRSVAFDTAYGQECQALNAITLTLEHTLSPQESREIESLQRALGLSGTTLDEAVRIQGSGANISYTRLYIPAGSQITRSSFPLTKLDSSMPLADTYAIRQVTRPGEKTTLNLEYSTPRLASCDITPVMIRQSGIKSLDFISRFR